LKLFHAHMNILKNCLLAELDSRMYMKIGSHD
jgi:hypothetical protein